MNLEFLLGGGSLGCNTLYSLAKLGVTNVALLEKDKLTAGKVKNHLHVIR